jgi:hypothetical protein
LSFALSKWYLDCVADSGDVVIAYLAELRYGALALRYASTLVQRAGAPTCVRATLLGAAPPAHEGPHLVWSAPALGASGRWEALDAEVADTVLARRDGQVAWRCLMPRARAEVALDDGPPIAGLGYAEHLTVTLAPWSLPIDELRWGRFLSEDAALVWIDWRGPHRRRVVLLDGSAAPARVDDEGLTAEDGSFTLRFEAPRLLREGAIGRTTLSILPAVETVFPTRILRTEERKWVARGVLTRGDRVSTGWVIHEVVRWP